MLHNAYECYILRMKRFKWYITIHIYSIHTCELLNHSWGVYSTVKLQFYKRVIIMTSPITATTSNSLFVFCFFLPQSHIEHTAYKFKIESMLLSLYHSLANNNHNNVCSIRFVIELTVRYGYFQVSFVIQFSHINNIFFFFIFFSHPIFNITSCEQYELFVEKIGKTWNEIQVPHDTQHSQNVNIIFFSCSLIWKKIHCKSKYYLYTT